MRADTRALLDRLNATVLTRAQRRVLQSIADAEDREDFDNAELVYERGQAWVGNARTNGRMVRGLANIMAIHLAPYSTLGGFERWTVTSIGRLLLKGEKMREGEWR